MSPIKKLKPQTNKFFKSQMQRNVLQNKKIDSFKDKENNWHSKLLIVKLKKMLINPS